MNKRKDSRLQHRTLDDCLVDSLASHFHIRGNDNRTAELQVGKIGNRHISIWIFESNGSYGDMVRFEAPALMFNSEASYVGPAAEPYLRRFFPSVLERLGDDKELLLDCRVCTGRIFISGLECT